jgi:hypothetical protein
MNRIIRIAVRSGLRLVVFKTSLLHASDCGGDKLLGSPLNRYAAFTIISIYS